MNDMKITLYELLGLVKDGKAPKLIKYKDYIYSWDSDYQDYVCDDLFLLDFTSISEDLREYLQCTLEILEEQKKIPEKLDEFGIIQYNLDYIDYKNIEVLKEWLNKDFQTIYDTLDLLIKNHNKLIDYLESKGDE